MDYNTQRPKLLLPEYGRIVQEMVDYARTLPEKAQRQACAETIVSVMASFAPGRRQQPDFWHKLWDHLALMADYELDIDYPYEIVRRTDQTKPARLPYPQTRIRYRHYGHLIEELTRKLKEMPEGEERSQLAWLVAGQMRRSLNDWNKDALSDRKVAADLAAYTDGTVRLTADELSATGTGMARRVSRARRNRRNF